MSTTDAMRERLLDVIRDDFINLCHSDIEDAADWFMFLWETHVLASMTAMDVIDTYRTSTGRERMR